MHEMVARAVAVAAAADRDKKENGSDRTFSGRRSITQVSMELFAEWSCTRRRRGSGWVVCCMCWFWRRGGCQSAILTGPEVTGFRERIASQCVKDSIGVHVHLDFSLDVLF